MGYIFLYCCFGLQKLGRRGWRWTSKQINLLLWIVITMAGLPRYVIFPNHLSLRITKWFESVSPEALSVYFANGRTYLFYAAERIYWDIQENNGLLFVYGCNWAVIKEVATATGLCSPDPFWEEVTEADNVGNFEAGLEDVDWDGWDHGDNLRRERPITRLIRHVWSHTGQRRSL